jgi:hypothetical protein
MSHRGEGDQKVTKKCHVLFEWPLSTTGNHKMTALDMSILNQIIIQGSKRKYLQAESPHPVYKFDIFITGRLGSISIIKITLV